MTLSSSQVKLYAAQTVDYEIALAVAAVAGIPTSNVTGDFATAWNWVANGSYLVIAVGGPANNALYYNQCGWAGHAAGSTPFAICYAPTAALPGKNYYENAAGQAASDTLYLATAYAYYALHGTYPGNWTSPPQVVAPAQICFGSSTVGCPCQTTTTGGGGGGGTTTYYYGYDSDTTSNPYGNDFYIGQLGYALHQHFNATTGGDDAGGAYFNPTGAQNATYVYGYWLISGLSMAAKGTSASTWGTQQAQAAVKAFNDMRTFYGTKAKLVLWADCEATGGGLDSKDYANNQAIYTAFVTYIKQNSAAIPGTYSSPYEWNTATMGSNFPPSTPGYYWIADYPGSTPAKSDLTTANPYWVNFPQTSEQAEIWQYNGSPDYNVARVLPG